MQEYKKPLIRVNKILVEKDRERIEAFVKRRRWNMDITNTGLYYMIYRQGEGDSIHSGDIIVFKYNIELLDGTVCYTTDSLGDEFLRLGSTEVENGLEEGLKLMRQGDKARLILAPHLAHGLTGDQDKIPPRAILLYDIEILEVREDY